MTALTLEMLPRHEYADPCRKLVENLVVQVMLEISHMDEFKQDDEGVHSDCPLNVLNLAADDVMDAWNTLKPNVMMVLGSETAETEGDESATPRDAKRRRNRRKTSV